MSDQSLPMRQDELLRLIARHQRDGMVPSAAVLAKEMGLAGESSVTPAMRSLETKGYIQVEGGVRGRQRFIKITSKAVGYLLHGLPIVGGIPAGAIGQSAIRESRMAESLDSLLRWEAGDFLLEVEGDSMVGAGIHPGALVLLRPGQTPEPGEVAAVHIPSQGGGLLKKVYVDTRAGLIRLRAAHPRYPDQEMPLADVHIYGVMRGLVRNCPQGYAPPDQE